MSQYCYRSADGNGTVCWVLSSKTSKQSRLRVLHQEFSEVWNGYNKVPLNQASDNDQPYKAKANVFLKIKTSRGWRRMCKYEANATIRKRYEEIWLRENWEWNGSGSRFSAFLKIINFLDQTSLNIRGKFLQKLWSCVGGGYHGIIWFCKLVDKVDLPP